MPVDPFNSVYSTIKQFHLSIGPWLLSTSFIFMSFCKERSMEFRFTLRESCCLCSPDKTQFNRDSKIRLICHSQPISVVNGWLEWPLPACCAPRGNVAQSSGRLAMRAFLLPPSPPLRVLLIIYYHRYTVLAPRIAHPGAVNLFLSISSLIPWYGFIIRQACRRSSHTTSISGHCQSVWKIASRRDALDGKECQLQIIVCGKLSISQTNHSSAFKKMTWFYLDHTWAQNRTQLYDAGSMLAPPFSTCPWSSLLHTVRVTRPGVTALHCGILLIDYCCSLLGSSSQPVRYCTILRAGYMFCWLETPVLYWFRAAVLPRQTFVCIALDVASVRYGMIPASSAEDSPYYFSSNVDSV